MSGILLDSHALYWLVSGEVELLDGALDVIGENQEAGTLFVSPITAWEIAIAARKRRLAGRPYLGEDSPGARLGKGTRTFCRKYVSPFWEGDTYFLPKVRVPLFRTNLREAVILYLEKFPLKLAGAPLVTTLTIAEHS